MRHIDALEKHCPVLRVDDDECHTGTQSQKLYAEGDHATCMFLVLSGAARADATPWPRGDGQRGAPASAPALIGASAFLTRSARQETVRVEAQSVVASACGSRQDTRQDATEDACSSSSSDAASSSASFDSPGSAKAFSSRDSPPAIRVLAIGATELAALRSRAPEAYVAVLLASTCSLSRLLRQFISLGLNRVWLRAGESAYVAGEQATSMFVLISGRVRLLRDGNENLENLENLEAEETRDDGETQSARDAVGEDGSASSFRAARRARGGSEERGRGETIGEAPLLANGRYPSTATCLRDSELVRMSRGALTLVCARHPNAASRLLEAMARKLHATLGPAGSSSKRPDLVTIALVPASAGANEAATATLAASLRDALATNFGPTLWLDERAARDAFTDGTVTRLENAFYRSKLTGWMAQQEENYRFILLQADASDGAWSRVCVSQADRVAVVAKTSPARPVRSSAQAHHRARHPRTTRSIIRPRAPSVVCCGAGGAEPPWSSCSCTTRAPLRRRRGGGARRAPRCGGTTCCAFRPTRTSSGWRGTSRGERWASCSPAAVGTAWRTSARSGRWRTPASPWTRWGARAAARSWRLCTPSTRARRTCSRESRSWWAC
jgi:lysophospholipid hydrolase